jgi:Flp pilus assembly protein TadD
VAGRAFRLGLTLLVALGAPARAGSEGLSDEVLVARGIERYRAGDLVAAVALLGQTPEASRSVATHHHLGLALCRLGRWREGRLALAAAARLAPARPRVLLDLGQAYLAEGNAAWAVRTLRRAAELAPEEGATRFYLGVALLRLGEAAAATAELRNARKLGGMPGAETDAQLALALYLAGKHAATREALDGPALADPQTRSGAARLLRASLQAEGSPASLISVELATGAVVDTNPLYEHETTAPTAFGPTLSGSLVLRPLVTPRDLLWLELAGARSFYFPVVEGAPDKQVGDASPSELRAGAGYTRRLPGGEGPPLSLSLGYRLGLTFLDGPPPLADEHHIFLEQHAGQLSLRRGPEGGSESQLRYSFGRSAYADLARSSWVHEVGFEHGAALLGGRLRLLGWLSVRHESAHSADYNQIVPGLGVGGSILGPFEVVIGTRIGYEYRNHLDSVGGVRWREQRIDNNLSLTGELVRALPRSFTLRAVYQRLQNFSTVESFDYGRDLFTLALGWSGP